MSKNLFPSPNRILSAYWQKKTQNSNYSLRALARDLEISPSYASSILNGHKKLPLNQIKDWARLLDMDEMAQSLLQQATFWQSLDTEQKNVFSEMSELHNYRKPLSQMKDYLPQHRKRFSLLENWYNIVILDLATCVQFDENPEWIAKVVGISVAQAQESLNQLIFHKLLIQRDGRWTKNKSKLRFSSSQSHKSIRRYHNQMIRKAVHELNSSHQQKIFEKRLITGVTLAANQQKIEAAKKLLNEALHEASNTLTEGDCTDVYQINLQFFPMTKINV